MKELNETIKRIVNNDVLTCQSMLVDELLKKEVFSYDDIENMYIDNSDEIESLNNEITELEDIEEPTEEQEQLIETDNDKIEELEREQEEPQEAYEWWVVTDWLERKLRDNNEILLVTDYGTWWGRQTSGQSIELDYIIKKIAEDIQ